MNNNKQLTPEEYLKNHPVYITLWLHPYGPHLAMIKSAIADYADQQTVMKDEQIKELKEWCIISNKVVADYNKEVEAQDERIKQLEKELEEAKQCHWNNGGLVVKPYEDWVSVENEKNKAIFEYNQVFALLKKFPNNDGRPNQDWNIERLTLLSSLKKEQNK